MERSVGDEKMQFVAEMMLQLNLNVAAIEFECCCN